MQNYAKMELGKADLLLAKETLKLKEKEGETKRILEKIAAETDKEV